MTANYGAVSVSVLLGEGEGGLAPVLTLAAGDGLFFVTISGVNGDTIPDLAVASESPGTVSVLLGSSL